MADKRQRKRSALLLFIKPLPLILSPVVLSLLQHLCRPLQFGGGVFDELILPAVRKGRELMMLTFTFNKMIKTVAQA